MATNNQLNLSLSGSTGTGAFAGGTSPTISLPLINNTISGYSTTATAAATTTLTVSSNHQQFFTGVTTQTVAMPVTSTLTVGQSWLIVNNSSGIVTVKSSGLNNILAMTGGTNSIITCIAQAGTTAADWNAEGVSGVAGVDSITGTVNQVVASAATGPVTLSLPQSIATSSGVTFASTTFSSTSGIIGTTTNDSAAAGSVGEYLASGGIGSPVSLTTATPGDIFTLSLTAGDWDVTGLVFYLPSATTNVTITNAWVSSTSATLPSLFLVTRSNFTATGSVMGGNGFSDVVITTRFSLAGTTTIYLGAQATFSISTLSAGGLIRARRVR